MDQPLVALRNGAVGPPQPEVGDAHHQRDQTSADPEGRGRRAADPAIDRRQFHRERPGINVVLGKSEDLRRIPAVKEEQDFEHGRAPGCRGSAGAGKVPVERKVRIVMAEVVLLQQQGKIGGRQVVEQKG